MPASPSISTMQRRPDATLSRASSRTDSSAARPRMRPAATASTGSPWCTRSTLKEPGSWVTGASIIVSDSETAILRYRF